MILCLGEAGLGVLTQEQTLLRVHTLVRAHKRALLPLGVKDVGKPLRDKIADEGLHLLLANGDRARLFVTVHELRGDDQARASDWRSLRRHWIDVVAPRWALVSGGELLNIPLAELWFKHGKAWSQGKTRGQASWLHFKFHGN